MMKKVMNDIKKYFAVKNSLKSTQMKCLGFKEGKEKEEGLKNYFWK